MTSYKKTLVFLLINIMLVSPVAMSHSLHLSMFVTSTVVNAHGEQTPCGIQLMKISNIAGLIEDALNELEDIAIQMESTCLGPNMACESEVIAFIEATGWAAGAAVALKVAAATLIPLGVYAAVVAMAFAIANLKAAAEAVRQCMETCDILLSTMDALLDNVSDLMSDLNDEVNIACILECLDCF